MDISNGPFRATRRIFLKGAVVAAGAAIAGRQSLAVGTQATRTASAPAAEGWRIHKLNTAVLGDDSLPVKAYTWVLQNPNVSTVLSKINDSAILRENLHVVGCKIDLQQV